MSTSEKTGRREPYKTKSAVNDLLGLSGAMALLLAGAECRLHQEQLDETLTEEQKERLQDLFVKLHRVADDIADFAREVAEQSRA